MFLREHLIVIAVPFYSWTPILGLQVSVIAICTWHNLITVCYDNDQAFSLSQIHQRGKETADELLARHHLNYYCPFKVIVWFEDSFRHYPSRNEGFSIKNIETTRGFRAISSKASLLGISKDLSADRSSVGKFLENLGDAGFPVSCKARERFSLLARELTLLTKWGTMNVALSGETFDPRYSCTGRSVLSSFHFLP